MMKNVQNIIDKYLAKSNNQNCDTETLKDIVDKTDDWKILGAVAYNPNCDIELLDKIESKIEDESSNVTLFETIESRREELLSEI